MKIEKKMVEIETIEFEKEDVEILEKAWIIVRNLTDKLCDENNIETTFEEDEILKFAERIHRDYVSYKNNC